jgi:hypothetical protein
MTLVASSLDTPHPTTTLSILILIPGWSKLAITLSSTRLGTYRTPIHPLHNSSMILALTMTTAYHWIPHSNCAQPLIPPHTNLLHLSIFLKTVGKSHNAAVICPSCSDALIYLNVLLPLLHACLPTQLPRHPVASAP